jgi:hypothetical protein
MKFIKIKIELLKYSKTGKEQNQVSTLSCDYLGK